MRARQPDYGPRAHVLCYANDFAGAVASLERARESACEAAEQGMVELASVQPLARLGRLAEAEAAARRAFEYFAVTGDELRQGKSLLNLGIVLRMRGKPAEAIDAMERASRLVLGDPFLLAALASNRAEALQDLDRFEDATAWFERAHAAFVEAGDRHAAAIVVGNIADLLNRQGCFDAALERYEQARLQFELSGADADVARLTAEEAEVLAAIGALEPALESYASCVARLESSGLRRELGRARFGMGLVLDGLGDHEAAGQTLRRALDELRSTDSRALCGMCAVAVACHQIRSGDVGGSAALLGEAMVLLEGLPARSAQAHAELAEASLDGGAMEAAREHLARAERLAEAVGLSPLRSRVRHVRGRLLWMEGRLEEASRELAAAMEEADAVRGSLRAEQLRVSFAQSRRGVFLDAYSVGLELGERGRSLAFSAVERLRARSLLDHAGGSSARDQNEQLHGAEHERAVLMREIDRLYAAVSLAGAGTGESEVDVSRLASLERRASMLDRRAANHGGPGLAFREPLTLDEAVALMPDGVAILQYNLDRSDLSAMVVRPGGVRVRRGLADARVVSDAIQRSRFLLEILLSERLSASAIAMWERAMARLSDLLLVPVLDDLVGITRLGISVPGELNDVPWRLLPARGGRVMEQFDCVATPSVSLALSRSEPRESIGTSLFVGVADEFAPHVEREAVEAADHVPGARVLIGSEATSSRVLSAIGDAVLLHIGAHCVFSARHPMLTRMKLADRWVTARDLARHLRSGCRVVLAGCDTGRSAGSPEERQGLVHALLSAGASQVLASLWALHDASARRLFRSFYRELAASGTGSEDLPSALTRVQRESASRGEPPHHWGGLFLTGGLR